MSRTLVVVSAGLSQPSSSKLLADRLAAATARTLDVAVESVELRNHAHDLVNAMLTGFPPAELKPALDTVSNADGLVVVTPTYAASFSGLFKSFIDVLDDDALLDKPVLIGATGGTARHSMVLDHALRPLFAYLRAVVVPTGVYAASEDWGGTSLSDRINRAAAELGREMSQRDKHVNADPFDHPVAFEKLLANGGNF